MHITNRWIVSHTHVANGLVRRGRGWQEEFLVSKRFCKRHDTYEDCLIADEFDCVVDVFVEPMVINCILLWQVGIHIKHESVLRRTMH
jgi:hypothetical protein